jgi:hypothetical protein
MRYEPRGLVVVTREDADYENARAMRRLRTNEAPPPLLEVNRRSLAGNLGSHATGLRSFVSRRVESGS